MCSVVTNDVEASSTLFFIVPHHEATWTSRLAYGSSAISSTWWHTRVRAVTPCTLAHTEWHGAHNFACAYVLTLHMHDVMHKKERLMDTAWLRKEIMDLWF